MRRTYFTSYIKLPIIILYIFGSIAIAQENADQEQVSETNIVCFAANKKWICAPEDQQEIASDKALKSLDSNSSELESSEVVIKPINIPKFNSNNTFDSASAYQVEVDKPLSSSVNEVPIKESKGPVVKDRAEIKFKDISASNPYAKLWSHQLIGVSSHQSAIRFVKQKQLSKEDVLILKSVRGDQEWWVVLYGLYQDKQTGIDNVKSLPENIDNPWLRPLKGLIVNGFIEKY